MYVPFIEECLRDASAPALRMTGGTIPVKPDDVNQVVTDADVAIGRMLVRRVVDAFPGHGVLDEESGAVEGSEDAVRVIDPLDGSSNYAAGSPLYGVVIGVVDPTGVVAGGMALPAFGEFHLVERGVGAYLNGAPLVTPPCGDLSDRLVAFGCDKVDRWDREAARFAATASRCPGVRMSNSIFASPWWPRASTPPSPTRSAGSGTWPPRRAC